MTATGLVVTDLSHLDVGLDIRGDFRGLVRFAVSSKPSRPSRRCDRVSTWCAGSASAVSRVRQCQCQSVRRAGGPVAGSLPVVMAVPPPAMPGVRQVGGVVHGWLLRAGHGVRQAVSC
jgi:hypothetical protein